jgi:hypothetical protein
MEANHDYPHVWRIRKWLPERFGQRCRILVPADNRRLGPNNVLVEFEDGVKVVATRWATKRRRD